MHLDWYKRRRPDAKVVVVFVEVKGFKKLDNHCCLMDVVFDNGDVWRDATSFVNHNVRYEYQHDGSCAEVHVSWCVQAQNNGVGVLVKLVE